MEDAEKELESISSELAYTTGCLEELNSQKENLLQEMAKVKEQLEHARDQLARLYDAQRELEREAHARSLELEALRQEAQKTGYIRKAPRLSWLQQGGVSSRELSGLLLMWFRLPVNTPMPLKRL